jgi:hypothetical protein
MCVALKRGATNRGSDSRHEVCSAAAATNEHLLNEGRRKSAEKKAEYRNPLDDFIVSRERRL